LTNKPRTAALTPRASKAILPGHGLTKRSA
jgi:hypothetical protein